MMVSLYLSHTCSIRNVILPSQICNFRFVVLPNNTNQQDLIFPAIWDQYYDDLFRIIINYHNKHVYKHYPTARNKTDPHLKHVMVYNVVHSQTTDWIP